MSRGCIVCFKHLKRNCRCGSPRRIAVGYHFRVPKEGKINDWEETLDFVFNNYANFDKKYSSNFIEKLADAVKGTKLEHCFKRLKENL